MYADIEKFWKEENAARQNRRPDAERERSIPAYVELEPIAVNRRAIPIKDVPLVVGHRECVK